MKRAIALLAFALLVVLAHSVRVRAGAMNALGGSEAVELGTHWLVDDAATATHLRRIEIAIAADRLPGLDRWLEHPHGAEVPWLPLFDLTLAAVAERFARSDPYIEQASVEDFVLAIPPWIGALTVLLVAWAVRGLVDGRNAFAGAIVAALLFALPSAAIRSAAPGQLDPSVWLTMIAAVQLGLAARTMRAPEPLDVVFGALACGLVGGLALASSMLGGCALFVAVWIGFLVRAFAREGEERALAHRAGLCYCAVAAFVVQLPLLGSAQSSNAPWIVSTYCSGISNLVIFSAAPFLFGVLTRSHARRLQTILLAGGVALLVYFAPDTIRDLSRAVRSIAERSALAIDRTSIASVLAALTPALLLSPLGIGVFVRRPRRPEIDTVLAFVLVSLAIACIDGQYLALLSAASACAAGLFASRGFESNSARIRVVTIVACVAAASFAAFGAFGAVRVWRTPIDLDARDEGVARVRALRWMRERTPAAGAFNAPTIPGDYAVLCAPELSSRVVYHARRPVLASAEAIANSPANLAEVARTLESADFERLVRVMHSADAAYVIASPRFTASSGSSALRQLSSATADDASSFAGFTRIHASPIGSADVGPVLSIWRLDAPRPPPAPARLAPR